MSHVVSLSLLIRDLDSLGKACSELGLELVRGQKNFRWYGKFMNDFSGENAAHLQGIDPKDYGKCEHAIRVKGNKNAYEVGLVRFPAGATRDVVLVDGTVVKEDIGGSFQLVYDFFAGGYGLVEKIGDNATALRQSYAKQLSLKQLRRQGYRITEKKSADGSIILKARK